ncbi:MAG: transcriptional repressor NrdR [Opitutales bacterium]|nr:transcriptional repressor NrdR [Opitutales bacterium]
MNCPRCRERDSRVIDSRIAKDGLSIRRRRECQKCGYRFTTVEEIVREGLSVRKRDGRIESFDRRKVLSGLRRACEKRPVPVEQIDMIVNDVVLELEARYDQEVASNMIGEIVMAKLKPVDQIAYIRFASVYRDFRDITEMEQVIHDLKKPL